MDWFYCFLFSRKYFYTSFVTANFLQFQADKFINIVRMKIYALLSGQLVWRAPVEPYTMINTCETMDWKRALALHLW